MRWELGATGAREKWEKTSRRYLRMQKWLRDNGYLVGRPPYGYRVASGQLRGIALPVQGEQTGRSPEA